MGANNLDSRRYRFWWTAFCLSGLPLFAFQNCSHEDFSSPSISSSSLSSPILVPLPNPLPTPTPGASSCVASAGSSCEIGPMIAGCAIPGYICTSFWGVYYKSPNGCVHSAGSWTEHSFNGTTAWNASNGSPTPSEETAGPSSEFNCTYIGTATDPFHTNPDGSCSNASAGGFPNPNTWTMVVPATGCTHGTGTGTIQCDGSCQ